MAMIQHTSFNLHDIIHYEPTGCIPGRYEGFVVMPPYPFEKRDYALDASEALKVYRIKQDMQNTLKPFIGLERNKENELLTTLEINKRLKEIPNEIDRMLFGGNDQ